MFDILRETNTELLCIDIYINPSPLEILDHMNPAENELIMKIGYIRKLCIRGKIT